MPEETEIRGKLESLVTVSLRSLGDSSSSLSHRASQAPPGLVPTEGCGGERMSCSVEGVGKGTASLGLCRGDRVRTLLQDILLDYRGCIQGMQVISRSRTRQGRESPQSLHREPALPTLWYQLRFHLKLLASRTVK